MPPAPPNRYFRYTLEDNDRNLMFDLILEEDFDTKLTAVLAREGMSGRTQRKASLDVAAWKSLWEALETHQIFTIPRARVQLPVQGPVITITLTEGARKALHKFVAGGEVATRSPLAEIVRLVNALCVQHFDRLPGLD